MSLIPGIKQISLVGNDMYIQGAFPVGVTNTEVDYLADPADTRLLAGRDPVIEEVSVGMTGSETGIETASGAAPLQITDAMRGMLRFLETNIKPVQDLHGYANPWPAGGGKNKLRPAQSGATISTVVFTVDEEGVITANGSAQGNADFYIVGSLGVYENCGIPSGEYIVSGNSMSSGAMFYVVKSDGTILAQQNNNTEVSVTIDSSETYRIFVRVFSGTLVTNQKFYCMIRPSSVSDSTFAPYSNICPIQGWTGCNVYVSPTTNQADATVYPCTWQDEAGTVYGGFVDVVSGWMTVTMAELDLGTKNWVLHSNNSNRQAWYTNEITFKPATDGNHAIDAYCEIAKIVSYNTAWTPYVVSTNTPTTGTGLIFCVEPNKYADATEFKAAMNGVQFVYALPTPTTYTFPGNQIMTQVGTNYIWTDCGDTITAAYVAVK